MPSEQQWLTFLINKQAFWNHSGNPKQPHALLTAGDHSSGFCNCGFLRESEAHLLAVAYDLIDHFLQSGGDIQVIDRVVGPQTGATKLAEFLANEVTRRRDRPCTWASPAKVGEGENKRIIFDDPNRTVLPGERLLFCDDVVTTGASSQLTIDASVALGGIALPYLLAVVNRSGLPTTTTGYPIIALITRHLPTWKASDCPLCQQGSEAIRAKDPGNWKRLNATY